MSALETCRKLGIALTPWQMWACQFLEQQGFRFCVDFGYENAEAMAEQIKAQWWNDEASDE